MGACARVCLCFELHGTHDKTMLISQYRHYSVFIKLTSARLRVFGCVLECVYTWVGVFGCVCVCARVCVCVCVNSTFAFDAYRCNIVH